MSISGYLPKNRRTKGKAVDFKFGRYIHRIRPNKSPLKILEKRECGHSPKLPKISLVPLIFSGTGKDTDFKFCVHIHRVDRNKSPLKNLGKGSHGLSQWIPIIFRALKYRGHCTVIFAIAQLYCYYLNYVSTDSTYNASTCKFSKSDLKKFLGGAPL